MSAHRDRTQKVTFVYSNLYQLYRNGKDAAPASAPEEEPKAVAHQTAVVIKTGDKRQVEAFQPMTLLAKKPEAFGRQLAKAAQAERVGLAEQGNALESLKKNLSTLNDLHARLRFMLKELEELADE